MESRTYHCTHLFATKLYSQYYITYRDTYSQPPFDCQLPNVSYVVEDFDANFTSAGTDGNIDLGVAAGASVSYCIASSFAALSFLTLLAMLSQRILLQRVSWAWTTVVCLYLPCFIVPRVRPLLQDYIRIIIVKRDVSRQQMVMILLRHELFVNHAQCWEYNIVDSSLFLFLYII